MSASPQKILINPNNKPECSLCYFIKTTKMKTCLKAVKQATTSFIQSCRMGNWVLQKEHKTSTLDSVPEVRMIQLQQIQNNTKNKKVFSCFSFPLFCSWSQWLHTLLSRFWSCLATRLISRPALLHRPRLNMSSCLTGVAAEATGLLCWVFGFCNWVSLLCSFTVHFFWMFWFC